MQAWGRTGGRNTQEEGRLGITDEALCDGRSKGCAPSPGTTAKKYGYRRKRESRNWFPVYLNRMDNGGRGRWGTEKFDTVVAGKAGSGRWETRRLRCQTGTPAPVPQPNTVPRSSHFTDDPFCSRKTSKTLAIEEMEAWIRLFGQFLARPIFHEASMGREVVGAWSPVARATEAKDARRQEIERPCAGGSDK